MSKSPVSSGNSDSERPDSDVSPARGKWRWFTALAVVAVLLCAAILLPETRYLRYADEFRELAEPIFCDDRDVDVVFLGSSRMARSVDAFSIAKAYRDMTGEDLRIVDLSKTGPSDAVMEILLSDLMKRRRVKLVIAEMGRPRIGQQWKILEKMGRVMPFDDYFRYAEGTSNQGLGDVLWDALQLRLALLEGGLAKPWTGCPPEAEMANVVDPTLALPKDDKFEKVARRTKRNGLRPYYANFLDDITAVQMDMAHDIADLARDSGTKIMFMSVNTFHDQQVSLEKREKFSQMFGAELGAWPPELYDFLRNEYLYSDSSHLDEDGAQFAAAWYAEKIRDYLSGAEQQSSPDSADGPSADTRSG